MARSIEPISHAGKHAQALVGAVYVRRIKGQAIWVVGGGHRISSRIKGYLLVKGIVGACDQERALPARGPVEQVFNACIERQPRICFIGKLDILDAPKGGVPRSGIKITQKGQAHRAIKVAGIIHRKMQLFEGVRKVPGRGIAFGQHRADRLSKLGGTHILEGESQAGIEPARE